MKCILLAAVLIAPYVAAPPSYAGAAQTSGYTVTRTNGGIRMTLHFARRSYPLRSLVVAGVRLTNLSRTGLYVVPPHPASIEDGCGGFAFVYAARSNGANAQPAQKISLPGGGCPVDVPRPFPVGRTVSQRNLIVLWTGRIFASAWTAFRAGRGWRPGPEISEGPTATIHLFKAPAPHIAVNRAAEVATGLRPPGAGGTMYYRDWAICGEDEIGILGWTPATHTTVKAPCPLFQQWHVDVAWVGMPVTSLNLGVRTRAQ